VRPERTDDRDNRREQRQQRQHIGITALGRRPRRQLGQDQELRSGERVVTKTQRPQTSAACPSRRPFTEFHTKTSQGSGSISLGHSSGYETATRLHGSTGKDGQTTNRVKKQHYGCTAARIRLARQTCWPLSGPEAPLKPSRLSLGPDFNYEPPLLPAVASNHLFLSTSLLRPRSISDSRYFFFIRLGIRSRAGHFVAPSLFFCPKFALAVSALAYDSDSQLRPFVAQPLSGLATSNRIVWPPRPRAFETNFDGCPRLLSLQRPRL